MRTKLYFVARLSEEMLASLSTEYDPDNWTEYSHHIGHIEGTIARAGGVPQCDFDAWARICSDAQKIHAKRWEWIEKDVTRQTK